MTPSQSAARIRRLEQQLMDAPKRGDVEHVRERLARRDAMYEAALARNEVLVRRLDEARARVKVLERGA